MIQRIQTLFLLAATLMLGSLFFSTMAYTATERVKYIEILPCLIFTIITTAIALTSIFLYRQRVLQIRLSIINSIILVAYQAWILYYFFFSRPESTAFSITAVFPIVAAILSFIAMRYIARDEAMVLSSGRLRKTK
ncbi:MAG: DUF4293 domain-containing protein [Rikenellaceae bacterium]